MLLLAADDPRQRHAAARRTMLAAVLTQLAAEAEAGRTKISHWRCQQLDDIAIETCQMQKSAADSALVAVLVRGAGDESLLSESALHAVLQRALEVLEPSWKTVTERGVSLPHRDVAAAMS